MCSSGRIAKCTTLLPQSARRHQRCHTAPDRASVADSLIGAALDCAAQGAVIPAQDLLGLGNEARMNLPGEAEGNWGWRLTEPDMAALRDRSWKSWLRDARRA